MEIIATVMLMEILAIRILIESRMFLNKKTMAIL